MVYPALLPLMRKTRLPVVDWADAPANLNGLARFAERRNLVYARHHISTGLYHNEAHVREMFETCVQFQWLRQFKYKWHTFTTNILLSTLLSVCWAQPLMYPPVADPALRMDSIHTVQWRAGVSLSKQTHGDTADCICDFVVCAICGLSVQDYA